MVYLDINKIFSLSCQPICNSAQQAWDEGMYSSKVDLAKAFDISRQAVYRYLKKIN
jgi:hypothetical protein